MTRASIFFAALIAFVELAAFGASFLNNMAEHPHAAVPLGILWLMFRYFTIWTNTLVGLAFGWMAWRKRALAKPFLAALVLWILIVGVVYHLLLAGDAPLHGLDYISNLLYHTAAPILVPVWWLAFAPKGGLTTHHAVIWLAWPLVYLVYAVIRGLETGFYPYFFLNLDKLGWGGLGLWCVKFLVAFWIGGLVIVTLGRGLNRLGISR